MKVIDFPNRIFKQVNNVVPFTLPYKPSAKYSMLLLNSAAEPLMPVRLYCQVNPHKIVGHFGVFDCIRKIDDYYVFFLQGELENFCSQLPRKGISTKDEPIVLARAKVNYKQRQMILDTDSYQRAIDIIGFLNSYTSKQAQNLEYLATYNRLIYAKLENDPTNFISYGNYDRLFSPPNMLIAGSEGEAAKTNISPLLLDCPLIEKWDPWLDKESLEELAEDLDFQIEIAKAISAGSNCSIEEFVMTFTEN